MLQVAELFLHAPACMPGMLAGSLFREQHRQRHTAFNMDKLGTH